VAPPRGSPPELVDDSALPPESGRSAGFWAFESSRAHPDRAVAKATQTIADVSVNERPPAGSR